MKKKTLFHFISSRRCLPFVWPFTFCNWKCNASSGVPRIGGGCSTKKHNLNRFPVLFAVDMFRHFGLWILNSQIKSLFLTVKLSIWTIFPMCITKFWDKKSANNECRHIYFTMFLRNRIINYCIVISSWIFVESKLDAVVHSKKTICLTGTTSYIVQ